MTRAPRRQPRAHRSRVATLTALGAAGLAFVVVAWSLPIDDFWLSMASGRAILGGADATHAIPLTWLPTVPGALNPQWGAQLLLGLDGLWWALALNALLLVAGLGLTLERMRPRAGSAAVAVAALLGLAVLAVHLLARAQSFSVALLPLTLLLLERLSGRWWLVPALGLITAAWANLHGAFIVGQLAAGCWAAGTAWAWWRSRAVPGAAVLVHVAAFAVTVVAPLANPAGAALLGYAYGQGTSDLVRSISVEWQPPWPTEPVGLLFWLLLVLVLAARVARRWGATPPELLLLAGTGALAASGIRHIPWFVLSAAPVLADDVGWFLGRHPGLSRAIGEPVAWMRGRTGAAALAVAAVAAIAFQPIRPALPGSIARLTPDEPVALADTLLARTQGQPEVRVFNEQVWGGYLAWRGAGRITPAMDGRIEIRSVETWQAYFDLEAGPRDAAERLARDGVRWAALLPSRDALISRLTGAGWEVVHESTQAVLLRAP